MANCVSILVFLRKENDHFLRRALEVEGERKKVRPKRIWNKKVEVKAWFEQGRRALLMKVDCLR